MKQNLLNEVKKPGSIYVTGNTAIDYLPAPVLVMRDTTERPEGIAAGTLKLVGTDEEVIYHNFKLLLEDAAEYAKMSNASNPYGDGLACKWIADILEQ